MRLITPHLCIYVNETQTGKTIFTLYKGHLAHLKILLYLQGSYVHTHWDTYVYKRGRWEVGSSVDEE